MAREKPPPDPPEDVPLWFVTYSDVITLLMTFFILLLTFASSEPESFERMQVSLFGGGGATGIAGPPQGPMEKDAIALRERPRSSRMTNRGSEMPAIHKDPALKSLSEGIKGMEETNQNLMDLSHSIRMPTNLLVSDDGEVTEDARQKNSTSTLSFGDPCRTIRGSRKGTGNDRTPDPI